MTTRDLIAEFDERLLRRQLERAFQKHTLAVLGRELTAEELDECVDRHLLAMGAAVNQVTA